RRARADRPLRTPDDRCGPRAARVSCAAGTGRDAARLREALGDRQVLAAAFAARRRVAVRARTGRRLHARSLPVGVRLALPSRTGARRLRGVAEPRADT